MPSLPLRLQVALCLCLAVGQVQAGVVISGTRQVYPQPRREITVQVTNDDRQAARLVCASHYYHLWFSGKQASSQTTNTSALPCTLSSTKAAGRIARSQESNNGREWLFR